MRIRQFIAAIMILLSLTAQARTAFDCGMMPGASLSHCCCTAEGKDRCPPGGGGQVCCDQVAPGDAPIAQAVAAEYGKHHSPVDLPALPAADPHPVPSAFDPGRQSGSFHKVGAERHRSCPLYLETARLRL